MPVAWIDTIPLVATAPVVAEETLSKLPEVKPTPVEAILIPTPVVNALLTLFWIVPRAVAFANTLTRPHFDDLV